MKTFENLKTQFPDAVESAWHQHTNGGGWVMNTARVDPSAFVGPDAVVHGYAVVRGNAVVLGNARVLANARVLGKP